MPFRRRRSRRAIDLTHDEALVLDALFTRWRDEDDFGDVLRVADEVDRYCLIKLGADVEGAIGEAMFAEHYAELVRAARERLRAAHDLD